MRPTRPLIAAVVLLGLAGPALGQSSDPGALFDEGIAARNVGQVERAIDRFRKVLAAQPEHVDARLQLATALTNRRAFDEARRHFDRVLGQTPDYHDARVGLARIAYYQGDLAGAERELQWLARLAPDHEEAIALAGQVAKARQAAQFEEAQALRRRGRFAEAERLLRALLSKQPRQPDILIELGALAATQGRHDEARRSFEQALQERPKDPAALLGIARIELAAGAFAAATARADEVLAQRPGDVEAAALKATIRLASGDAPGAEQDLRRLVEAHPRDVDLKLKLGDALRAQERDEEARVVYEAARQIDAGSEEVRSRVALKIRPRFRLDVDGGGSDLGLGQGAWSEGRIGLAYQIDQTGSISGGVEFHRRYGQTDMTVDLRYDHRWTDWASTYVAAGGTPDATFRPQTVLKAGAAVQLWKGFGPLDATVGLLDLEYARYADGEAKSAKVGIQQYLFGGRLWLTGQLMGVIDAEGKHLGGYAVRADWMATDALTLFVGYTDAPDSSGGRVVATYTVSAGLGYALNDNVTLRISGTRIERKENADRTSVTLGLTARF